jgi:hypothetical protein
MNKELTTKKKFKEYKREGSYYDSIIEFGDNDAISIRYRKDSKPDKTISDNIAKMCLEKIDDLYDVSTLLYKYIMNLSINIYTVASNNNENIISIQSTEDYIESDKTIMSNLKLKLLKIAKEIRKEYNLNNFDIDISIYIEEGYEKILRI